MDFNQLWADFLAWSATPDAARLVTVALSVAMFEASVLLAFEQNGWLKELQPGYFERTFRGPKPKREASIVARIATLNEFKATRWATSTRRAALLVVCGFVVPSIIVGLVVYCFPWLFNGAHALIRADGTAVLTPTLIETAWSVLSQLALGVIGDNVAFIPGTFASPNVIFAMSNPAVLISVLAYRYFVSIFVVGLVHFLSVVFYSATHVDAKLKELEEALEAVRAENAKSEKPALTSAANDVEFLQAA